MGKEWGSEKLGSFYTDGKVRKRREWRGVKDTFYDYARWLHIMGILSKFIVKPRNINRCHPLHLPIVKVSKSLFESSTFIQNGLPAQTCLHDFKRQKLK